MHKQQIVFSIQETHFIFYSTFQAQCLVVLTSKDLDLNSGFLSKKVLEAGGTELEKQINKLNKTTLEFGDVITTGSGNLRAKGVKRLIFGYLPKWSNNKKVLQVIFVKYLKVKHGCFFSYIIQES